jgi:hypothetical protein
MYHLPAGFGGDAVLAGVEHLNVVREETREGLLFAATERSGLNSSMNDWLVSPGKPKSPVGLVWDREKRLFKGKSRLVYSLTEYGKTLVGQFDQAGRISSERMQQARKRGLDVGCLVRISPKAYAYSFYPGSTGYRTGVNLSQSNTKICMLAGWTSAFVSSNEGEQELSLVGLHDPSDVTNDRIWTSRYQFDAVVMHPEHGYVCLTQSALSPVKGRR